MMLFSCDTCRAYLSKVLLDNIISQGLALCVTSGVASCKATPEATQRLHFDVVAADALIILATLDQ